MIHLGVSSKQFKLFSPTLSLESRLISDNQLKTFKIQTVCNSTQGNQWTKHDSSSQWTWTVTMNPMDQVDFFSYVNYMTHTHDYCKLDNGQFVLPFMIIVQGKTLLGKIIQSFSRWKKFFSSFFLPFRWILRFFDCKKNWISSVNCNQGVIKVIIKSVMFTQ